jgi:hypothetical protein
VNVLLSYQVAVSFAILFEARMELCSERLAGATNPTRTLFIHVRTRLLKFEKVPTCSGCVLVAKPRLGYSFAELFRMATRRL